MKKESILEFMKDQEIAKKDWDKREQQFISFNETREDYHIFPENMEKKNSTKIYNLKVGEECRISTGENIRRIK